MIDVRDGLDNLIRLVQNLVNCSYKDFSCGECKHKPLCQRTIAEAIRLNDDIKYGDKLTILNANPKNEDTV
ncbi:MAG: hypothetical protein LBU65_11750 [Planctomycetaceae bacterium]|jgi:hypothetical protein|nr:hypothetical protein [Planctomycetaceae bacterium]